jgi:hypothetical protein
MQHDPSAVAGMPPHVTLMYPFLRLPDLSDAVFRELGNLLSRVTAFECVFSRVAEFEEVSSTSSLIPRNHSLISQLR